MLEISCPARLNLGLVRLRPRALKIRDKIGGHLALALVITLCDTHDGGFV